MITPEDLAEMERKIQALRDEVLAWRKLGRDEDRMVLWLYWDLDMALRKVRKIRSV